MNKNINEIGSIETIKRIWKSYASGLSGYLTVALICNAVVALSTPALPELIPVSYTHLTLPTILRV